MQLISTLQIGKSGLTDTFIETLKSHFKNHQNVKISVLKSATRDKKEIKKMAEKIIESLGKNYTYRIIGFTIIIKKWRKPQS
ncbi:MAG TPA: YhbY family RNA-binding protein [Candidatus Paceibacterota bacterium]|nr:YhbY family RNA-binding protein [Candidatus Paceibacterota bacterium]